MGSGRVEPAAVGCRVRVRIQRIFQQSAPQSHQVNFKLGRYPLEPLLLQEVGRPAAIGTVMVFDCALQRSPVITPLTLSARNTITPWPRPLGWPFEASTCAREFSLPGG